jgi:phage baseplate assembly protein W
MDIAYPFHLDSRGRTAAAAYDEHVRNMIEQVLFTTPGERVNRPTFGTGLLQALFAPNSAELAATVQFTAQGALQQWLGDVIEIESLVVDSQDSTLSVSVTYTVRQTNQRSTAQFTRQG